MIWFAKFFYRFSRTHAYCIFTTAYKYCVIVDVFKASLHCCKHFLRYYRWILSNRVWFSLTRRQLLFPHLIDIILRLGCCEGCNTSWYVLFAGDLSWCFIYDTFIWAIPICQSRSIIKCPVLLRIREIYVRKGGRCLLNIRNNRAIFIDFAIWLMALGDCKVLTLQVAFIFTLLRSV